MSTHTKKLSNDKPIDKSDILSILESIETMFEVYQNVLNSYTQSALLLSITTEAEMLLLKLRVMQERWKVHLPFKEAITVNFYSWHEKISKMSKAIGGAETSGDDEYTIDEYCPSKHYLLDLYECLDESPSHNGGAPYYAEQNVSHFITEQARMRGKIARKWKEYRVKFSELVTSALDEHLVGVLTSLAEGSVNIRLTCHTVLRDLSAALYNLYEATHGSISRDQFARMAARVFGEEEYGGDKTKNAVEHEINEVRNSTPEDQWETSREEDIRVSFDLIKEIRLASKVFSYLGRDKTMLDNPAGLGRFLWSVRHNISNEDLSNLLELLYRIAYLSQDRERQVSAEPEPVEQAPQQEPKDADAIYRKRKETKLNKPGLPKFFNAKLASNEDAVETFYEILHHCGFYIGRPLLASEKKDPDVSGYAGWKWAYLREAFVRLGFIPSDSPKKGFADFLANVFPFLVSTNVQRGFNDRGGYVDANAKSNAIREMVNEFQEVADFAGTQEK